MQNHGTKAEERLSTIGEQTARIQESLRGSLNRIRALGDQLLEAAQAAHQSRVNLANLKAEARFLSLTHGLELSELPEQEDQQELLQKIWKDVSVYLQPVGPSEEWIERIRNAAVEEGHLVLSEEESAVLRERLEATICPLCVNYALDGTCTLEVFDECPITKYQDLIVDMIQKLGHRPWMEDYFQRMYRDICPLCRDRSAGDVCVPREEGDCALFTYLPAIVKTVEDFMKERAEDR